MARPSIASSPASWPKGAIPGYRHAAGPGYTIACECYQPNHRSHFAGSLSMAHAGRDTGGSQFFLTFRPDAASQRHAHRLRPRDRRDGRARRNSSGSNRATPARRHRTKSSRPPCCASATILTSRPRRRSRKGWQSPPTDRLLGRSLGWVDPACRLRELRSSATASVAAFLAARPASSRLSRFGRASECGRRTVRLASAIC